MVEEEEVKQKMIYIAGMTCVCRWAHTSVIKKFMHIAVRLVETGQSMH